MNKRSMIAALTGKQVEKVEVKMKKIPLIIALNLTEYKFYTYSENGLMINRFAFKDMVMKYGDPIATSPDGLNYIFKKKRKAEFSVLHLDEREFTLIRTI